MKDKTKTRLVRLERWAATHSRVQYPEPNMFLIKLHSIIAFLRDDFSQDAGASDSDTLARILGYNNREDMGSRNFVGAEADDWRLRFETAWRSFLAKVGIDPDHSTQKEVVENLVRIFEISRDKVSKNAIDELAKAAEFYGIEGPKKEM